MLVILHMSGSRADIELVPQSPLPENLREPRVILLSWPH